MLATHWLNLGNLGSERDRNPELIFRKRNGRIYRGRAWFRVVSLSVPKSQDISQKGHSGCPSGSVWALWDLDEVITPNHFYGSGIAAFMGLEHGCRVISLFVESLFSQDNSHFGCPLGSIWKFLDLNKIIALTDKNQNFLTSFHQFCDNPTQQGT